MTVWRNDTRGKSQLLPSYRSRSSASDKFSAEQTTLLHAHNYFGGKALLAASDRTSCLPGRRLTKPNANRFIGEQVPFGAYVQIALHGYHLEHVIVKKTGKYFIIEHHG